MLLWIVYLLADALRQLPFHAASTSRRVGRKVLIRIDGATHEAVDYITARRMSYSVGLTLPGNAPELLQLIPDSAWTPTYDSDGQVRDGAWVAELTGLLDLARNGWPTGMRVIARKERPHPGAQLRITDVDGHRVTPFATSTRTGGPAPSCPTWNCATAAAPAARTGSAAPRTPAWAISRCMTSPRTRSGAECRR